MIEFEWDEAKAEKNLREHGIAFIDVLTVFDDPYRITLEDSVVDHELRWRTIDTAQGVTVLLVIHLEEDSHQGLFVRIISARKATASERSDYEQNRTNDI